MKEQGTVIGISGTNVKLKLSSQPKCKSCGLCAASGGGNRILTITTQRPLQLNQQVILEVNHHLLTLSSLMLYGIPLAGFISGAILGYFLGKDILATIMAVLFAGIGFLLVRFTTRKMRLPDRIMKITRDTVVSDRGDP